MRNIVLPHRSLAKDRDAMVGEFRWTREDMLSAMWALFEAIAVDIGAGD